VAINALLELAWANEKLIQVDEDRVEWVAPARLRLYRLLGGTERTLGSFKAEVRANLAAGGDGFGEVRS